METRPLALARGGAERRKCSWLRKETGTAVGTVARRRVAWTSRAVTARRRRSLRVARRGAGGVCHACAAPDRGAAMAVLAGAQRVAGQW